MSSKEPGVFQFGQRFNTLGNVAALVIVLFYIQYATLDGIHMLEIECTETVKPLVAIPFVVQTG